jgi:hypothetical protein
MISDRRRKSGAVVADEIEQAFSFEYLSQNSRVTGTGWRSGVAQIEPPVNPCVAPVREVLHAAATARIRGETARRYAFSAKTNQRCHTKLLIPEVDQTCYQIFDRYGENQALMLPRMTHIPRCTAVHRDGMSGECHRIRESVTMWIVQ